MPLVAYYELHITYRGKSWSGGMDPSFFYIQSMISIKPQQHQQNSINCIIQVFVISNVRLLRRDMCIKQCTGGL